jgi:hypothetical protein
MQDVRRSVMFIGLIDQGSEPLRVIRDHMLRTLHTQVLGWVLSPYGWVLSKAAAEFPETFAAVLQVARFELGLSRCFCARLGRGPSTLSGFYGAERTLLLWWPADLPREYHTLQHESSVTIDLRHIFTGYDQTDICWIQFFAASTREARKLRARNPDMLLLADDPDDFNPDDDDRSTIVASTTQEAPLDPDDDLDPMNTRRDSVMSSSRHAMSTRNERDDYQH